MAKGPEIPQTDSAEIEILIERLKQNKLEQRDVELIERLLGTVLVLVNLLQRKNISIKRLREMIVCFLEASLMFDLKWSSPLPKGTQPAYRSLTPKGHLLCDSLDDYDEELNNAL